MKKHNNRILFICKKKMQSGGSPGPVSSGLFNSANLVSEMLNKNGIESKVVDVVDNNSIDKEVSLYKPTYVIIEALWVVPEKFKILAKLHPTVKWIIRIHSEVPFIAHEGIATQWLFEYMRYSDKVYIGANSKNIQKALEYHLKRDVLYLPNYYPVQFRGSFNHWITKNNEVHIGCFGAIRPFKNHLIQAMSAIKFADKIGKKLYFYINSTRVEGHEAAAILKNLKNLFLNYPKHVLVEMPWYERNDFLSICKKMDLGMQVSFTETYNIVTADLINNNIPVIVSPEVKYAFFIYKSNPNSVKSIVSTMHMAQFLKHFNFHLINKIGLYINSKISERIWVNLFK